MNLPCKALSKLLVSAFVSFTTLTVLGQQAVPTSFHSGTVKQARTINTSLTSFGVPFQINNQNQLYVEVQLYVSTDSGQTWQFHNRETPDAKEFPYHTKGDGEYWFALKTLDRNRKLLPDGQIQPELKVVVDTKKPSLDFAAKSDAAGRVVCRWKAHDQNIDPASLVIEYRDRITNNTWKAVEYKPLHNPNLGTVFSDQLAWWPEAGSRELEVQLKVKDKAGNETSDLRSVVVPQIARRTSPVSTANFNPNSHGQLNKLPWETNRKTNQVAGLQCKDGVCQIPKQQTPGPDTTYNNIQNAQLASHAKHPYVGSLPEYVDPPVPVSDSEPRVARAPSPSSGSLSHKNIEWESKTVNQQEVELAVENSTQSGKSFDSDHEMVVATGSTSRAFIQNQYTTPKPESAELNDVTPVRPKRYQPKRDLATATIDNKPQFQNAVAKNLDSIVERPVPSIKNQFAVADVKPVNSHRFLLDYNIDSIDPSGVGKVTLWATQDGGETWKSWATDNDNQSPFPVDVPRDGTYGFRVVIQSKDGLTGRAPSRGDLADMVVRIDTNAPQARIDSVPYGRGEDVGHLVIHWTANDEQLRIRPIELAYSTKPQGPWTTIEKGVRNTGKYAWKVGREVPDRVFLRMQVYDAAGNITVQQLTRPIDVSGLVPRGRINGVQAISTADNQ